MKTFKTTRPYDFFDFIKSDFNSKFTDNFLNPEIFNNLPTKTPSNIKESNDFVSIEILVPGFDKDEMEIILEKDLLTIKGKKEPIQNDENESYILKEHSLKEFSRSFKVNPNLDTESIESTLKKGILFVKVPKIKKIENKKTIKIN